MAHTPTGRALSRMLASGAPEAGATVMGTGIVSIALSLDGAEALSQILFGVAAGIWLLLALLVGRRTAGGLARVRAEVHRPTALTWVAGTGVLGARLVVLGWTGGGIALLLLALVLWVLLVGPVLSHWRTPTVGASLLLTVATQSLAVLCAAVGLRTGTRWLVVAAVAPFALGLCSYAFVMARFDLGQLTRGRGDQWITGGALAISTLAAADIATGARTLTVLWHGTGPMRDAAVALWVASMLWLPVLVVAEARRPRLGYDVRRWSTVFPVGMYAVCSFAVGDVARAGAITSFARVWAWVALATWAAVAAAMVRKLFTFGQDDPARSA